MLLSSHDIPEHLSRYHEINERISDYVFGFRRLTVDAGESFTDSISEIPELFAREKAKMLPAVRARYRTEAQNLMNLTLVNDKGEGVYRHYEIARGILGCTVRCSKIIEKMGISTRNLGVAIQKALDA